MKFKKIQEDIPDGFEKIQIQGVKSFRNFVVEKYHYEFLDGVLDEEETSEPSLAVKKEVDARIKVNLSLLWISARKGFFAQLLSKLNIYGSSDPRYTTMCTNGFNIQYHPDFVLSQTEGAVRFVLCHEILHCVGDHMSRRGSRDPLVWNWACDYAINPILDSEVIQRSEEDGKPSRGAPFEWPKNPDGSRMGLYEEKYEGMRAEDIYDLLINDSKQKQKAEEAFKNDPDRGMHVIDSDNELGEPDGKESIVQDVEKDQKEPGEGGDQKGPGEGGDQKGPGEGGDQKGPGEGDQPGEEGDQSGEGGSIVGKRVRITAGPNAGKIGTIKQVLSNGDIIIE